MYMSIQCMYTSIQCMYMCHSCTTYVHVYTLYVHVYTLFTTLTSCLNRFSWPAQGPRNCAMGKLCPTGGRPPKNASYRCGPDDLRYNLVLFSTFEELKLPISGPMERAGVTKLYEPFPTPCLYVAPAARMVGRVPLIPLFLAGNSTPTSTASIRGLASQWASVTLQQQMAGVAAR